MKTMFFFVFLLIFLVFHRFFIGSLAVYCVFLFKGVCGFWPRKNKEKQRKIMKNKEKQRKIKKNKEKQRKVQKNKENQ